MAFSSNTYKTKAIVLSHNKLAESDLIISCLAESGEQIRAVAKGARKPQGKLAGKVQLFSVVDFLLARGKNLDVVADAKLIDANSSLASDYDKMIYASVILDVTRLTTYQDSEDPYMYAICMRALESIKNADDVHTYAIISAAYVLKVLSHHGWRPETCKCILCEDSNVSAFSASAGGTLCDVCAERIDDAEYILPDTSKWLSALITSTFDELEQCACSNEQAEEILHLTHLWAATQLDARIKSLEILLGY